MQDLPKKSSPSRFVKKALFCNQKENTPITVDLELGAVGLAAGALSTGKLSTGLGFGRRMVGFIPIARAKWS